MTNDTASGDSLSIALVGSLPPPPGGVASSIASIKSALDDRNMIHLRVISWHELWKLIFARPDVIHFNFSRPMKRLAGTLFGRLIGSRVVHTIHGNTFCFELFGNALAVKLSHGFILLNRDVMDRFRERGIQKLIQLTPILDTGVRPGSGPNCILDGISGRIALVYAHGRQFIDGKEVYGFSFVAQLLPDLAERGYKVFFLDPSATYSLDELDVHGTCAVIHHRASVDFRALLPRMSVYLRPTSTDGNSVAVLEALHAGVPVLASDAVPRPDGVITYRYGDADDFLAKIDALDEAKGLSVSVPNVVPLSSAADYIAFLRML